MKLHLGLAGMVCLLGPAQPAQAQAAQPMTVQDAARMAVKQHPAAEAAEARVRGAGARVDQARTGYLPKLGYQESWQASNNPVFVFSTLLTQRRFTEANFAIDALNRPDAINNFQSQVGAEQMLFDGGQTRRQVKSAQLGVGMAKEQRALTEMELVARAARAYYGALLAEEALKVADASRASAEADLKRAESRREAGMATEADVLSVRVHLAAVAEQIIVRRSERDVALAALNEALGRGLDTPLQLTTGLQPVAPPTEAEQERARRALAARPEVKQAGLAIEMSQTQAASARSAYLPQVSARLAGEANRGQFVKQYGGNWFAGVSLRWNISSLYTSKAAIQEAVEAERASAAQKRQLESGIALQVRAATARLQAARERTATAAASVAQAAESVRITRDRYENGLATMTDLLRNESAQLEASLRRVMAIHDQRVAAVELEMASGSLTPDSEVLQ
ncbi:MAG: TolC family protein [Bryobacterales bacterium]|nr:TolC family protein [Bryobacterales bacterium]